MKSKDIGGVFMKEQQTHFLQLLQAVVNLNEKVLQLAQNLDGETGACYSVD